ncbi:MAG: glycerophosphodiester phosphodiesterase [Sphingomonadaceae bacterium]
MAEPILIAHRGASADLPEHTLAAYVRAIAEGADYIEPDLVATKDGFLVARHENEIGGTTDVSARPEFANRRTVKRIDGQDIAGWFTEDFTLAELKTLRARERLPDLRPGNAVSDGQETIPTLEEILELVAAEEQHSGRRIGIYPETKHPSYFREIGLPLEERLLETLADHGYASADDPVFIQSFEVGNLQYLRTHTQLRLVQLMASRGGPPDNPELNYAEMATPAGLAQIATYADGIGVERLMVIPRNDQDRLGAPTQIVADAHRAGLLVHVWTFRPENAFLPADYRKGTEPQNRGDAIGEIRAYLKTGIDGFFSDSVADGAKALKR